MGLNAIGSDLNPLAVVIGKASVEIAPKFAGRGPVHKGTKKKLEYIGNDGLAEDISFYGSLIHEQASKELTTIYPKVEVYGNNSNTSSEAIGWMWTRTVPSPDPAFQGIQVPIASTFALCIKEGKEAWLELKVDKEKREYHFDVNYGNGASFDEAKKGTKRGHGANFSCIFSGAAITPKYIRSQGKAGNIGQRLIAVVIKSKGKINYLPPSTKQEKVAISIEPDWRPELKLTEHRPFSTPLYGLERYDQLFTNRQLFGLNTFIRILQEQRQIIYKGRPVKTRFFEW